jgi:DNA modification methylase/transcriptional regulator with XRE-family HTH domain
MEIKKQLMAFRQKANLSQPKLAELLGASLASVARWERGVGNPSPAQVKRIAELYRSQVEGLKPLKSLTSAFASRGARKASRGQGVLGEVLPQIGLSQSPGPPILDRLMRDGLFTGEGKASLLQLFQLHTEAAETVETPFSGGISAGKNTYTYDAHTYHTKVPPQGICELLSYYLPRGGMILDPFAGSGMTGVAATVGGLDCILNELSPAACFISDRFAATVSPLEFEAGVDALLSELSELRRQLYSTACRECGRKTELLYTVWSYRVICSKCGHEFLLWDHCRKYGAVVREHKILTQFPCPSCKTVLRKSTLQRTTVEPVLVGYKCCGSRQREVNHQPSPDDVRTIKWLENNAPLAEGFYPQKQLPKGVNLRQPAKHGLDSIEKFYTRRNLSALSHIWKTIHRIGSPQLAAQLAFAFTSMYKRVTRLSEFRFWGGSGNTAVLNVPYIFDEPNVFVSFARKARTIQDHLETTASSYAGKVLVINGSATSLDIVPDGSIDLIFTDPPFGGNINYSEMNLLWESWLGRYTDNGPEAVVNRVQGKGVSEYRQLMGQSLKECFRVLRPEHWMLLMFMNSSKHVWTALRNAITGAGFEIKKMDIFDKEHGTFKQFVSENTAGMDLVLHCRKPENRLGGKADRPHVPTSDVFDFLRSRKESPPTNTYLHVERADEVDFRTLYSEWIADCFRAEREVMDFAAFRQVTQQWLNRDKT